MDIPEIVEVLDNEFRTDPYGAFTAVLREIASAALANEGAMSEGELATVINTALAHNQLDPEAHIPTTIDVTPYR